MLRARIGFARQGEGPADRAFGDAFLRQRIGAKFVEGIGVDVLRSGGPGQQDETAKGLSHGNRIQERNVFRTEPSVTIAGVETHPCNSKLLFC